VVIALFSTLCLTSSSGLLEPAVGPCLSESASGFVRKPDFCPNSLELSHRQAPTAGSDNDQWSSLPAQNSLRWPPMILTSPEHTLLLTLRCTYRLNLVLVGKSHRMSLQKLSYKKLMATVLLSLSFFEGKQLLIVSCSMKRLTEIHNCSLYLFENFSMLFWARKSTDWCLPFFMNLELAIKKKKENLFLGFLNSRNSLHSVLEVRNVNRLL
jgi:hypothetical protein